MFSDDQIEKAWAGVNTYTSSNGKPLPPVTMESLIKVKEQFEAVQRKYELEQQRLIEEVARRELERAIRASPLRDPYPVYFQPPRKIERQRVVLNERELLSSNLVYGGQLKGFDKWDGPLWIAVLAAMGYSVDGWQFVEAKRRPEIRAWQIILQREVPVEDTLPELPKPQPPPAPKVPELEQEHRRLITVED